MTRAIRFKGNDGVAAVVFRRSLKEGKTAIFVHEKDKLGKGWEITKQVCIDIVGRKNNHLYSYTIPVEQLADWFPAPFVLE